MAYQNKKISIEVLKYPLGVGFLCEAEAIENLQQFIAIISIPGLWIYKNGKKFVIVRTTVYMLGQRPVKSVGLPAPVPISKLQLRNSEKQTQT